LGFISSNAENVLIGLPFEVLDVLDLQRSSLLGLGILGTHESLQFSKDIYYNNSAHGGEFIDVQQVITAAGEVFAIKTPFV